MVNILSKQVNFLITSDFAFKLFSKIFSIKNSLLLQEWGDFILDFMIHSELFIAFLIQNDIFLVFLHFFLRNLQSDIYLENTSINNPLFNPKHSPSKSHINHTISELFYHRLFGCFPKVTPFKNNEELFQKILLDLTAKQNISDKGISSDSTEMVPRDAYDRDGLLKPSWDLLALRKFNDVFKKNLESLEISKKNIVNFNMIFPSLSLAVKFLSIAFLKNRKRSFFKNYVSNELFGVLFVKILGELSANVLQFKLDLNFLQSFYFSKKFDYIEKMNFIIKYSYSASDDFNENDDILLQEFKEIYDTFFQNISKEVKPSPPNNLNSQKLLLKIYEESQFPFGDCFQIKVNHSEMYKSILQKISQFFETMAFFTILHVNFDENVTSISESEKNFRDIISKLDALHTFYDDYLEVKLIVREENMLVLTVQCTLCGVKFDVENTLENREGNLLCTSCQGKLIHMTQSKKQFYGPFRNN